MKISDFDYQLPDELIAQEPLSARQASRMMVVNRAAGTLDDRVFTDLPDLLTAGDVLVVNNTKVFPARLLGRSETGANVEIFLVRELEDQVWESLARPARRLPPGTSIYSDQDLSAEVIERVQDGQLVIRFAATAPPSSRLRGKRGTSTSRSTRRSPTTASRA